MANYHTLVEFLVSSITIVKVNKMMSRNEKKMWVEIFKVVLIFTAATAVFSYMFVDWIMG